MRKFFILLGSAVAMTSFAHAENWTGKLLDASCYDRQHNSGQSSQTPGQTSATQAQSSTQSSTSTSTQTGQAGQAGQSTTARSTTSAGSQDTACIASSTTTQFALEASAGKVYKLDDNGNTRAMAAMRSRADRSSTAGQSSTTTGGATSSQQAGITAKVDGTESGGIIKVTTIELQ